MSNAPEPLPAHLRPVTVEIPVTWTPEQALAVFELLDDLRERIWEIYNVQLQDLLREQQQSPGLDDSDDTLPPTQSAPFIRPSASGGRDRSWQRIPDKQSCCSIKTAIPSSRPAFPQLAAHSGGQACP